MKPITWRPVSSSISRLSSTRITRCQRLRRSSTASPSPASVRFCSPRVRLSWSTTKIPLSPSVVFAFVGPRPVVRASALTTVLEILAASAPSCLRRSPLIAALHGLARRDSGAVRGCARPLRAVPRERRRATANGIMRATFLPGRPPGRSDRDAPTSRPRLSSPCSPVSRRAHSGSPPCDARPGSGAVVRRSSVRPSASRNVSTDTSCSMFVSDRNTLTLRPVACSTTLVNSSAICC